MKETKKERKKEAPVHSVLYLPMNEKSGERIVC